MAPWIQELPYPPHLDVPITITDVVSIMPAGPIPAVPGDTLYLSNLDDIIGARVFTPTVYFYRCNGDYSFNQKPVMATLREALSKVLVPYYPFSGRLRGTENGKLEVFFGPERGVLLVEAHSDITVSDFGDLEVPNPACTRLIYKFPNEEPYKMVDMPLLIAQVTKFRCGGFSLGLRICHCLCDGLGAMQFLKAWADTAQTGELVVSPKPCWNREMFRPRDPPVVTYPHTEFMKIDEGSSLTTSLWKVKPIQRCYSFSREFQAHLKLLAQPDDNAPCKCTTFDALGAHLWRSWVKALDVKPLDYQLRLTFSVNVRSKLKNPPLRDGFYGNVVCVACATSTVSELVNGPLSTIARLVQDARLGVSEEYVRSTVDYVEAHRPMRLEFGGKLTITQWTRFPIYESADFGWGRPAYAGPIDLTPTPQVCVFLPQKEAHSGGALVVCICLPESAIDRFRENLCLFN